MLVAGLALCFGERNKLTGLDFQRFQGAAVVEALLQNGCDPAAAAVGGRAALEVAEELGHSASAALLRR
jgi:hypothetical protein